MGNRTKVLFLAADALEPDLLKEGAACGRFPAFARLLERSLRAPTRGPLGLYAGAIWPSLVTGTSPARHGSYCQFEQFDRSSYRDVPFLPERMAVEPFWVRLSRAGRRVGIIDAPLVPLTQVAGGVHIVDWGSHDPMHKRPQYWPPGLGDDVARVVGRAPVRVCDAARTTAAEYRQLRDGLVERTHKRVALAEHLLRDGDWDFFACVFSESHCAGHQFWHFHDPTHPRHDPALAAELGDPLLDVYVAIDRAVGRLVSGLDDETTVIFLASHGMGPHYDASFMLDAMLQRLENPSREDPHGSPGWGRSLPRSLWRSLPLALRQSLGPDAHALQQRLAGIRQATRRSHRRFFAVPNNDASGAVRINVVGRERHGLVQPGLEYEKLRDDLRSALLEFVNADTGTPLIEAVYVTGEMYHGPFADDLPDLLIEWSRAHPVRAVSSPRTGTVAGHFAGSRTGDHKVPGLLTISHPGLRARDLGRVVDVMDIAPSVSAMLGVPPEGFDGVPLPEMADPALRS